MILVDYQIRRWAEDGGITPYDPSCINPASIDLKFGEEWIDMESGDKLGGIVDLHPGYMKANYDVGCITAILATTIETIKLPPWLCAEVKLKTTPSRLGLGHPIADWIDPGFRGQLTLMLHALKMITLHPGQRIVQLVLYKLDNMPEKPYGVVGHYQNQSGPTPAWLGDDV